MNKTFSITVGIAAGAAALYLILNPDAADQLRGRFNRGSLDKAGDKVHHWGTKQRVTGTGTEIFGKVKQGVGNVTGDDELAADGLVDQVKGAVKDTAGQAAHAAVGAIRNVTE